MLPSGAGDCTASDLQALDGPRWSQDLQTNTQVTKTCLITRCLLKLTWEISYKQTHKCTQIWWASLITRHNPGYPYKLDLDILVLKYWFASWLSCARFIRRWVYKIPAAMILIYKLLMDLVDHKTPTDFRNWPIPCQKTKTGPPLIYKLKRDRGILTYNSYKLSSWLAGHRGVWWDDGPRWYQWGVYL